MGYFETIKNNMKLSPNIQYKLAFWSITGPVLVPFLGLVLIAVFNPLWFRSEMLNWVERFARTLGEWRDEKTYVKYYYDKAHLFDMLKD
jgi:hypothetical protein